MIANFTVLVIEDDLLEQRIMTAILEQENLALEFAASGQEGVEKALTITPDLIILDVLLPDSDGFEVCRQIRKIPQLAEAPVLMVTVLEDNASRLKGIESGADDFVSKPYSPIELRARVRTIARLNRFRRLRDERNRLNNLVELTSDGVVIVDRSGLPTLTNPAAAAGFGIRVGNEFPAFDQGGTTRSLSTIVQGEDGKFYPSESTNPGVEVVFHSEPERSRIVEMHVKPIRWNDSDSYLVTLHDITDRKQAETEIQRMNLVLEQRVQERTADLKEVNQFLLNEISERKAVEEQLRYLSTHDHLTGLFNRAFFETEFTRLKKSRQYPLSVIMLDVNGLKMVNDSSGYEAGDRLLKRAASALKRSLRFEDIIARFGGDEFIILLPQTNAAVLETVLVRIRSEIETENGLQSEELMRINWGSATAEDGDNLSEILRLADHRLVAAKLGTNR